MIMKNAVAAADAPATVITTTMKVTACKPGSRF
jgi:hypothetical protein